MAYAQCPSCTARDESAEPEAAEYWVNGLPSCRMCIEWVLDTLGAGQAITIRRLRLVEQAEMAR